MGVLEGTTFSVPFRLDTIHGDSNTPLFHLLIGKMNSIFTFKVIM